MFDSVRYTPRGMIHWRACRSAMLTVLMVILAPKLSTQLRTRSTGPEFPLLPVLETCVLNARSKIAFWLLPNFLHKQWETVHFSDIHVVRLDDDIRIDESEWEPLLSLDTFIDRHLPQRVSSSIYFRQTSLMRLIEQSIHIRQLDFIVIVEQQL